MCFPIYFESSVLVIGELSEEEEVLQWLITQKTEDCIELITRVMLEGLVEETQYLAVYFCKYIVETIQFSPIQLILFQIDTSMNFSILSIYNAVFFWGVILQCCQ
jgi:hypothetical protein